MKKVVSVTLAALMLLSCVVTVFAADTDIFSTRIMVDISGNDSFEVVPETEALPESKPWANVQWVTWQMIDENGNMVDIGEARPDEAKISYISKTTHPDEEYTISVTYSYTDGTILTGTRAFKYYSYQQVERAIQRVLTQMADGYADGHSNLISIEQNKDIIGMNVDGLYPDAKAAVGDIAIITELNSMIASEYPDWSTRTDKQEKFCELFDRAVVNVVLANLTADTAKKLIEEYDSTVNVSATNRFADYSALSTTEKDEVHANIATRVFTTPAQFSEGFRTCVWLNSLDGVVGTAVKTEIDNGDGLYYDYKEGVWTLYSFDFTGYNTLTPEKKEIANGHIATTLDGGTVKTLTALQEAITAGITYGNEYEPPASNPDPGPTPPGGSTSTGGGGFVFTDPIVPQTPTSIFNDLHNVPWAKVEIEEFASKGIVNGTAPGIFEPEEEITREAFVAIVVRAFGFTATGDVDYSDVDKTEWYYDPIRIATINGIITGTGTRFGVGEPITRQDMAVILHRTANILKFDLTAKHQNVFDDISTAAEYAKAPITELYQAELVNGMGNGIFAPLARASRAEAVKMIYNVYKLQ